MNVKPNTTWLRRLSPNFRPKPSRLDLARLHRQRFIAGFAEIHWTRSLEQGVSVIGVEFLD